MQYSLRSVIVCSLLFFSSVGFTNSNPSTLDALSLAQLVADRPSNEGRVGTMHFRLINSAKRERTREALMAHSDVNNVERIAIFFTQPSMIEETAFLSLNYDEDEDENWLYLPATERVRRLPTSDRGDYFLGTDLTYGDIKDNFKFNISDWDFALEDADAGNHQGNIKVLLGKAKSPEKSEELGYASFRAKIDTSTAFPIWAEYTDVDGELLKKVEVLDIALVGGAQTALHFSAENYQTGHKTIVHFTNMRHVPDLDETIFEPDSLAYGVPDVQE
ncbi:MAG: outer membrane lipoprotein-sorting protein [Pseudomonadota bacterium]